ncbi:MAG: hypothetical protein HC873_09270 [Leptolyngbyaceae cyanobacterium SL_1_1]|nr:hypothetical protein [Leptolyngbyaceae cyanobacterium RM1_1_2]NJO09804.1 hypothetical protein [Leptolyngbyaceae cyanobacterium SL_1_1]
MVRAVEQIKRELSALEQATEQLAQEVTDLYHQYLTELGQAAKRQLILASYHLCTQAYPDRFLQLSLHQRQKLQQSLQQLGNHVQAELLRQTKRLEEPAAIGEEQLITLQELPPQLLAEIAAAVNGQSIQVEAETAEESTVEASQPTPLPPDEAFNGPPDEPSNEPEYDSDLPSTPEAQPTDPLRAVARFINRPTEAEAGSTVLSPTELLKRHMRLEQRIRGILRALSQDANQVLKQVNILPDLPESILAAAAEAERSQKWPPARPIF